MTNHLNESGAKYLRELQGLVNGKADVYSVLRTFNVTCPASQHAIKKLLCAGLRDKGSALQDLREARDAVTRAIELATGDVIAEAKTSTSSTRAGWRYFECECGAAWWEAARDRYSPSCEYCNFCAAACQPLDDRETPELELDGNGNLIADRRNIDVIRRPPFTDDQDAEP